MMTSRKFMQPLLALLAFGVAAPVLANPTVLQGQVLRADQQQVKRWNQFVEGLHALHRSRISSREVYQTEELGGYSGREKFYRQINFFDRQRDRQLSRLQWETEDPDKLHLIEVFEYDEEGRVHTDYLAAFLPDHRNAPIQTLINLHNYNDGLHAFRQFDASGRHIYEQCRGSFRGKPVFLSLEEHELRTPEGLDAPITGGALYQACFSGVETDIEPVLERVLALADGPIVELTADTNTRFDTQAMQQLEEANRRLFRQPNDARLYLMRADAHRDLRQHQEAIEDYSHAIALDDKLDEAYFGRGLVHGRAGNLQQAVADLSIYIQRQPESSLAYTKRGVRYIWMGKLEQAEADLNRAIALNYRNAEAHDDLGVIHAQRGAMSKALHHFETALSLDPSYQKAYHNKAMVLYTRDAHDKALLSINNALSLDPENRNSLLLKASILEALGETEQAALLIEHAEFLPEGNWTERFALD